MQKIVPHLWFDGDAEEACRRYTELIPGSAVVGVTRYGKAGFDQHGQPAGQVMTVTVELGGCRMVGLNGGPHFRPTPAVSYLVTLADEAAVERFWAGLGEGGTVRMELGTYDWSPRYGRLDDRFAVSWQVMLGSLRRATTSAVTPALLFTGAQAGKAEAAIAHYAAIFPGSGIERVLHHDGSGADPAGTVSHARFQLAGEAFIAMDSAYPHGFGFSPANSFLVLCQDQGEIDHYWHALSAVPAAERCGWLCDRFGLSWQIVPAALIEMMTDPDPLRVARVTEAFMGMGKLEIAALERAYAA